MNTKKKSGLKRNPTAAYDEADDAIRRQALNLRDGDDFEEWPWLIVRDTQISLDCADQTAGFLHLANAFHLNHWRHAIAKVRQLAAISIVNESVDELRLNLMVAEYVAALRRGVDPSLALQMCATDSCALKTSGAYLAESEVDASERIANISNKFHRTYAMQLETDARCRNGAKTDITVNNTVAVNAGALVQRAPDATAGSQGDGGQTPRLALTNGSQMPMPVLEPDVIDVATEPEALTIDVNARERPGH